MHLKGTKSMAMSGRGCERLFVAAELANSLVLRLKMVLSPCIASNFSVEGRFFY